MTYKTEAIILRSFDTKEYDRMYTIFSREHGKMCVLGVGTRKPTAKLASGLEPLTKSEIFLVRGRRLDRVKGVIIDTQYPGLKKHFELLSGAKKTVTIIENLALEREQSDEIYEALDNFLGYLDRLDFEGENEKKLSDKICTAKLLQLSLLWKIIQWSGHEPKLFQCIQCNSPLAQQEKYSFSFPSGILCNKCSDVFPGAGAKISKDTIKLLRIFLFKDAGVLHKIKSPEYTLRQTVGATKMMIEYLLGHKVEL